ncbi:kinase-like protein [Xylaria venustula]|nr:kinase-like protein [Xylaria venustula]
MRGIPPSSPSPSPSHSPSPPPPPPPQPATVLFSVPTSELPAPLPSVQEIEKSPNVLKELWSKRVVRMGQQYVVKYGGNTKPVEGKNMIFARQHLQNMVPRVFAIYQRPRQKPLSAITYIIMEYLHARPLSEIWSTLSENERLRIIDTLHHTLQILRSLPPPDYFGGLGSTSLNDEIFSTKGEPNRAINGPFRMESELIQAFISRYRTEGGDRVFQKAEYYRHVLPHVLQGNGKPVFTHGDLQRNNIMVGSEGKVMIIDWATSGWYPIWWEYAMAMQASRWDDDWHRYTPKWMSEFPNHYAWLHMLLSEIWC